MSREAIEELYRLVEIGNEERYERLFRAIERMDERASKLTADYAALQAKQQERLYVKFIASRPNRVAVGDLTDPNPFEVKP